ncbi:MAG: hypothetical protein AAGG06_17140 [Pseudomonadota bacterium]
MALASPRWKETLNKSMAHLGKSLNDLAATEFFKSDEYRAYVRANVDAKEMRKDLETEAALDEFLGLVKAIQTGDASTAKRLSVVVANAHKPRKGKLMKAADIMKAIKAKLARKFKLSGA